MLPPRLLIVLFCAVAFGTVPVKGPARADSDTLRRVIIGLGAAAVANDAQRRQDATRQSTGGTRSGSSGSGGSRASAESARIAEARDMQSDLAALGFDVGPVDGQPGPRTRRAIEAFQVSRGFAPTGLLTDPQRLVLNSDAARANGDRGEAESLAVLETQTYLRDLGYDTGRPDGVWGPRSQRALDSFRRDTGSAPAGLPPTAGDMSVLYGMVHGVAPVSNRMAGMGLPGPGTFGAAPARVQPSFDCGRAGPGAEQAICASNRLAALDLELARSWTAMGLTQGGNSAMLPRQREWLAQRNRCGADTACIEASLRQRIRELGGNSDAALASVGAVESAPGGRVERDIFSSLGSDAVGGPDGTSSFSGDQAWPAAAAERVHMQRGRILRAPDRVIRRLALLAIERDPSLLAADSAVEAMMNATASAEQIQEFRAMNALRKAERIEAEREALLGRAQTVPEVTPDAPIHVSIHMPMQPGEFVEGVGLSLDGSGVIDVTMSDRLLRAPGVRLRGSVPDGQVLPLSRDEASALLDRLAAGRREGKSLVRVVRGRMTSYGTDETVEEFAAQGDGRFVPATFVIEDATVHMIRSYNDTGVEDLLAGSEPFHVWRPDGVDRSVSRSIGQTEALALARSLGIPVEDGHVVGDGQGNWTEFNALSLLGREPELARDDGGFVRVAALLLPDGQRRAFFGDRNVTAGNRTLQFFLKGSSYHLNDVFPDEFTRRDAELSFFENYFEGIMARTPTWPMPVRQKIEVRLGEYDFEEERFPLRYLSQQGGQSMRLRVVSLPAADKHIADWGGLVSADRMSNFPEFLNLPRDKARILRQVAQNDTIYLAWWADFDWGTDGAALERKFAAAERSNRPVRTGRATLKRVGLFADAALTAPVLEIAPEALFLEAPASPDVADASQAPQAPVVPAENLALSAIQLASVEDIMGHGARLLGADRVYDVLARGHQNAQRANEFELAGVVEQLKTRMRAGGDAPVWLSGRIDLGRYDLDSGTFDMGGTDGLSLRQRTGQVNITVELIGPNPFRPLAVSADVARAIVESSNRQITYYIEVMPEAVSREREWPEQPNLKLLARPQQIVFFQQKGRSLEEAAILGRHSLSAANAEERARLDRTFTTDQFAGLSERVLQIDAHVMDLLAVASGASPDEVALDTMMIAAWRDGQGGVGPEFFRQNEVMPDASQRVLYRPSFRSWLRAKADALGKDFVVQIASRPQDWCRQAAVLSRTPQNRAIDAALLDVRDRVNRLNRTLSQAQGPVMVDERFVQILQRPSLRGTGCEQWGGLLRLMDTVHEHPATDGHRNGVQVAFTVETVKAFPNQNGSMDVLIEGRANKTWALSDNGEVAAEIVPWEPEPEPGPERVAEVQSASTAGIATDRAQAGIAAASIAKAMADAQADAATGTTGAGWLDASGLKVVESVRDVVGLHLGQDMDTAHATISALPGVIAAFETTSPSDKSKTGLLAYQRIYVRRGGTETIILAGPAPDGPVLAIVRRLVETERTLPLERIEASVIEKYGPPDSDLGEEWGVSIWASAPAQGCIAMADDAVDGDRMVEIATDNPAQDRKLRDVLAQGWLMAPPNLAPGAATSAANCGEVLAFGLETPLNWGHSGFNLTLIDMKALADLESAGVPASNGFEIDF